jgi:hypothetical protein
MISNKTLATIFLITLNMERAASSGTKEPNPSGTSTLLVKKSKSKPTSKSVLKDETDTTEAVQTTEKSTEEVVQAQESSIPQINKEFEKLIDQKNYREVIRLGLKMKMKREEFMKQLGPAVKTLEQYKGFIEYLRKHKMVALFYVHGDIGVVREVILANSSIYDMQSYVDDGDLETALPLTLNNDCHDRVISFLNVRQEVAAVKDEPLKQDGYITSFETFVYWFLRNLAPENDDMALRRFLAHCEDEFRTNHSDILDAFCQKLVEYLRNRLDKPKAANLLIDMIGQHSLLTPKVFTKGFLYGALNKDRSNFIKYGWAEALQEGLKREYEYGGSEKLWQAMGGERSGQLTEKFPETEEGRAIACKRFPTKKQKEEERIKKVVEIICSEIEGPESSFIILPTVLWSIVAEYAVSLIITKDLTTSAK